MKSDAQESTARYFSNPHKSYGDKCMSQGRFNEAVAAYRVALTSNQNRADLHNNLATALWHQGSCDEAMASWQQSLRIRPNFAVAYNHIGIALRTYEQLDAAEASLRRAVECEPRYASAHSNLGNVLKDKGLLDEALNSYRTALAIAPYSANAHSNLVYSMIFHSSYHSIDIYKECCRWNTNHAAGLRHLIKTHTNTPDPNKCLRIGYISPDFCWHVLGHVHMPLLAHHDHERYKIFCYSDVARPDDMTEKIQNCADVWRSTAGLMDWQVAELVRSDQIDILVDLTMHMGNGRLLVFAQKPAPVQITWSAYPGTTGLTTIDYRLTDPYLDPPGLWDACYSEKSVRLPDTFWCYDPLTARPPGASLPAKNSDSVVTFGCLNNFCKVNNKCLSLWARVLREVPTSQLLLMTPDGESRRRVLVKLASEGIDEKRISFVSRQARLDYLATYDKIDVALDPFPYNGHVTSLDALWMGVPVVTLVSTETLVGRAGLSQLHNLGLDNLAAYTLEQYVSVAIALATNLNSLQDLRSTLRQRMQSSPLMDGKRFAGNVEEAYRHAWQVNLQAKLLNNCSPAYQLNCGN